MDRLEDQANTEDRYSRTRDDLEYDDPPQIWNSGDELSTSGDDGAEVTKGAGPASGDDGLEYPAHPVVGFDDGELLFTSSDLPSMAESDSRLEVGDELHQSEQADLAFVERRSQPWLGDNGDVGSAVETHSGSEAADVAVPWPTLDDSDADRPEISSETESRQATGLSTSLDLNADDHTEPEHETIETSTVGDQSVATSSIQVQEATTDDSQAVESRRSCRICTAPVSQISMKVDGNILILESCDECDSRRWRLDGQPIDLKQALDEVGEHAGRRS